MDPMLGRAWPLCLIILQVSHLLDVQIDIDRRTGDMGHHRLQSFL